jgi:hypothetical protein
VGSQIEIADALLINTKIATGGAIPSLDHDLIIKSGGGIRGWPSSAAPNGW